MATPKPNRGADGRVRSYTVRYRPVRGGQPVNKTFRTKREADDFLAAFEYRSREGTFTDPREGKVDFAEYCRETVDTMNIAASSKKCYRAIIGSHIEPAFRGRSLASVARDYEGIEWFVHEMPVSAPRRAAALVIIRAACRRGARSCRIPPAELDGLSVASSGRKGIDLSFREGLTDDELRARLEALAAELPGRLRLAMWLMRGCGLRVREALAVNVAGLPRDGSAATLRVYEQVSPFTESGTAPLKHRSGNDGRTVAIPLWLRPLVLEHLAAYGTDGGYLFGVAGKRASYEQFRDPFRKARLAAGLSRMGIHDLRRLYATANLTAKVSMHEVSRALGHADPATTVVYSGWVEQVRSEMADVPL